MLYLTPFIQIEYAFIFELVNCLPVYCSSIEYPSQTIKDNFVLHFLHDLIISVFTDLYNFFQGIFVTLCLLVIQSSSRYFLEIKISLSIKNLCFRLICGFFIFLSPFLVILLTRSHTFGYLILSSFIAIYSHLFHLLLTPF